jgi:aminopeptidase S
MGRVTVGRAAGTVVGAAAVLAASLLAGPEAAAHQAPLEVLAAPDIDVAAVQGHLDRLQQIAEENGGNRAAGGAGYEAAADHLVATLTAAGYEVHRRPCSTCPDEDPNIIADWPGGDPDQVIMLGGHLDGVTAGPAINDNGSGTATLLEIALTLAEEDPALAKHVRFAWWASEERGLQGSWSYVNELDAEELAAIEAYLNFDMVGSPNAGYFVYDDDPTLERLFVDYFDALGIPTEPAVEARGRSDHAPFAQAGVAVGGLFTGADARKTAEQAKMWGGTAGEPFDPCYHRSCDTTDNIDATALDRNADAIAYALWTLAG